MARDITALHPDLQVAAAKLKEICKAHGISINYSECLRTKAEQDALYAKGRTAPGKIVQKPKEALTLHSTSGELQLTFIWTWMSMEMDRKRTMHSMTPPDYLNRWQIWQSLSG